MAAEGKIKRTPNEILEIVVVILLGITALLTAWASWIGALHGGNQSTNYTESNNIAADGNARWNEASQNLNRDMSVWDQIYALRIELEFADKNGKQDDIDRINWQLNLLEVNNVSDELKAAIEWADSQEGYASPFMMEGFIESYYADADAVLAKADEVLKQGNKDNQNGDTYGLVSVIYSVVLFLLGICNSFKSFKNQLAVTAVSIVAMIGVTIFMFTIPMPTGFNLLAFFS